jgi:hypothetical protein
MLVGLRYPLGDIERPELAYLFDAARRLQVVEDRLVPVKSLQACNFLG